MPDATLARLIMPTIPFVRGDSARTISGTGLGLAIVQRIVDNHTPFVGMLLQNSF